MSFVLLVVLRLFRRLDDLTISTGVKPRGLFTWIEWVDLVPVIKRVHFYLHHSYLLLFDWLLTLIYLQGQNRYIHLLIFHKFYLLDRKVTGMDILFWWPTMVSRRFILRHFHFDNHVKLRLCRRLLLRMDSLVHWVTQYIDRSWSMVCVKCDRVEN